MAAKDISVFQPGSEPPKGIVPCYDPATLQPTGTARPMVAVGGRGPFLPPVSYNLPALPTDGKALDIVRRLSIVIK